MVASVDRDPAKLEAERKLCERAHQGDREALGEILQTYGPRLYRAVLLPRLGRRPLAEEALGMVYIKVVERFHQFTWQDVGVYPWLRVVALRIALDLLRKQKREHIYRPRDIEREINLVEEQPDHTPSALEQLDLARAKSRVVSALELINPRYAQVIQLRILEEKSREEAAEVLGVTVGTLDVVLHRALAALKKSLAEDGADS